MSHGLAGSALVESTASDVGGCRKACWPLMLKRSRVEGVEHTLAPRTPNPCTVDAWCAAECAAGLEERSGAGGVAGPEGPGAAGGRRGVWRGRESAVGGPGSGDPRHGHAATPREEAGATRLSTFLIRLKDSAAESVVLDRRWYC